MAMFHMLGKYGRPWIRPMMVLLSGIVLLTAVPPAMAGPRDRERHDDRWEFRDSRYHHDRIYPARGFYVPVLPRDHRVVVYRNARYYFHGGAWYRPLGGRFVVVAPPIGLFIPFLPPYYTTIWVAGVPYYYANEVYYMNQGDGYVVVTPPKEPVSQAPPPADQMFIYPRQGQSAKQQADDRFACHQWAVGQTGFDPTQPPTGTEAQRTRDRADYQRAMAACLDGRGYTVK
jgi:hypothetical protein